MPDDSEKVQSEILDKLQESKNRVKKWTDLVAGMTSSIAVAITIAMATGFLGQNQTLSKQELTDKIYIIETKFEGQTASIKSIKKELENINSGLKSISNLPEGAEWKTEASKISQNVSFVSERIKALEEALTTDPAKALAVPILRKDLDNIEKSLRSELAQTRTEIERMYDQNKWFIGLIFTIALSVLGMAVSSFTNRKDT